MRTKQHMENKVIYVLLSLTVENIMSARDCKQIYFMLYCFLKMSEWNKKLWFLPPIMCYCLLRIILIFATSMQFCIIPNGINSMVLIVLLFNNDKL